MSFAVRAEVERRHTTHRSGKIMVGKAVLAEKPKRLAGRPALGVLRLREIEKVIRARYGRILPESDDDSVFRAVALSLTGQDLTQWCRAWAPWALVRAEELLQPAIEEAAGRRRMLTADAAAALLGVSYAERAALHLNTIGATDVDEAARRRLARQRKRERDRQRQQRQRRDDGASDRSASISKLKPWTAAGISRATWYRRARETVSSQVVYTGTGDETVSSGEPDRSLRSRPSAGSSLRSSPDPFAAPGPQPSSLSFREGNARKDQARQKAGRAGGPDCEAIESGANPAARMRCAS